MERGECIKNHRFNLDCPYSWGKSNRWATWNIVSSKNIFQSCNNRLLKIMSNLNGEWGEYNKHESILCKWI